MKYLYLFLIAVCCSSCSKAYITPKYVYPQKYESLSCSELIYEQEKLKAKLKKLYVANIKEGEDSISDLDYTVGSQISESLGEYDAISQIVEEKKCLCPEVDSSSDIK